MKWLKGEVLCCGFFLLEDLKILWKHFLGEAPAPEKRLFKTFDFYLFFRFVHNGYLKANSRSDWVDRLLGVQLDKTFQKTDWFKTSWCVEIQRYLVDDTYVVYLFIFYIKPIIEKKLGYISTWTHHNHQYFRRGSALALWANGAFGPWGRPHRYFEKKSYNYLTC